MLGHSPSVRKVIRIAGVLTTRYLNREAVQICRLFSCKRYDRTRIQTAGQEGTDWNIGDHLSLNGGPDLTGAPFDRRLFAQISADAPQDGQLVPNEPLDNASLMDSQCLARR